jgi:hypothetical protein
MLLHGPKNEEPDKMHIKIAATNTANSAGSFPPLLTLPQADFEITDITRLLRASKLQCCLTTNQRESTTPSTIYDATSA